MHNLSLRRVNHKLTGPSFGHENKEDMNGTKNFVISAPMHNIF